MGLAILTGSGWSALRQTIPGFTPVAERYVVLAAVRDLEAYQQARLEKSDIRAVPGRVDQADLRAALTDLRRDVDRIYLHVDLDSLDISVGRANEYSVAGGPTVERLLATIGEIFERFVVEAAAITAYDPKFDTDGEVATAARRVSTAIARGAAGQRHRRHIADA